MVINTPLLYPIKLLYIMFHIIFIQNMIIKLKSHNYHPIAFMYPIVSIYPITDIPLIFHRILLSLDHPAVPRRIAKARSPQW